MNLFKQFKLAKQAKKIFPKHKEILCTVREDATNPFYSVNFDIIISKGKDKLFGIYIHDGYITIREKSGKLEDLPIRLEYLDRKAWVELLLVFQPIT